MHLKEVHVENFKSFGRKLTIPFEPGYTGITGPNGSGKSNIGDAILFVLGPNSPRAIRAGRLTDLIFNGGQGGKPANYTLVSLTFDNTDRVMPVDADEVVLTRRVKRMAKKDDPDGYSSYFYVNDRASKKKEFVDLLNHARISADGYNITQQGDVLNICNMSNVERRKILDDMAGITTFDKDINTADKRRTDVEENLERIGIVLEEIERALKQLDKDRAAAEKLRTLQTTLKETKAGMAYRRKADLESQLAYVHSQIERFSTERTKEEEKIRDLKAKLKEVQAKFAETEEEIRKEGGEEVEKLQEQMKEARDRMVRFEEKINFAKQELTDARDEATPLRQELARVEKEHKRTLAMGEEAISQHQAAEHAWKQAKDELSGVQDTISQSTDGAMELNRALGKLKNEHEAKQIQLHEQELIRDRTQERMASLATRLEEAGAERDSTAKDLEEVSWQISELEKTTKGAGATRKQQEKQLFTLRKQQAEFARQNEEMENRIRRLQREYAELQAKQEASARITGGMNQGVQGILAAREKGELSGIVGTIAELANADPDYANALEIAAGGRMQAVVVDDDGVAAQCIAYLKQNRLGRVTFLPLTKMVPGRPRGQALMKVKQDGCVGFALDLIDFNPRYQNAFWYVFGDTLVAKDMNAGRRLMGGVRIVTKDGELFEASGAMVGGNTGKRSGVSFTNSDRGRLDELLAEIGKAESAQEDALAGLQRIRDELANIEETLQHSGPSEEQQLAELQERKKRLDERLTRRKAICDEADVERAKLAASLEGVNATIGELQERLAAMETERENKSKALLSGGSKELRKKAEALEAAVREHHETAVKLQGRADVARKQADLVADRVKELEEQITAREGGKERYEEEIKRYSEALKKSQAEVEALMKMEQKATGSLKGLRTKRDKLFEETTTLQGKIEKVADRMETHYGLITAAKAKLPGLEEALGEALIELEGHEIADPEAIPDMDELRKTLRTTESAIERLGPVNMRALEEFEAQDKRRRELNDETARLKEQRSELMKLVEEIQTKKKAALMTVFEAINTNFAEVYARLSMGGKALMELEDPDEPFNGGLILKAQPMGKRVTRLDALSGGEKSLTSMAFIFALQQYEPSPFYYLDEVDQNLDAVNSELLAKLVKDQAGFAQFIQVSLRKITLKEARHLYGVTQTTPGQSEVIANFDLDQLADGDEDTIESRVQSMVTVEVKQ